MCKNFVHIFKNESMDYHTYIALITACCVLFAMLLCLGMYLLKLKMALRRKKNEQEMKRLVSNMENGGKVNDTNLPTGHENAAAVLQVSSETKDVSRSKVSEGPSAGSRLFHRVKSTEDSVSYCSKKEKVSFHSLKSHKALLIGNQSSCF